MRAIVLRGRPYDRDQLGRLQRQEQQSATFFVGRDCAQRVMLAHLLQHWEWAVAKKLGAEAKRVYDAVRSWESMLMCMNGVAAHCITDLQPILLNAALHSY